MASLHVLLKYFHCLVLLLCLQLASAEIMSNSTSGVIAKPDCQDRCGNIRIPYPFGIGRRGCFVNEFFKLTCNNSVPMIGTLKVTNISVDDGQMTVESIIARTCNSEIYTVTTHLRTFTVSATKNKLISIGCDTMAGIDDYPRIGYECSNCNSTKNVTSNGACDGMGCCETSIPPQLSSYDVSVVRVGMNSSYDNPCSYAFIAEKSSFQFSPSYLQDFKNKGTGVVPVVVDWTIGFVTCDIAATNKTSYACGPNTLCESCNVNAQGYRCKCKPGFEGNPYLSNSTDGHCKDINECDNRNLIHDDERCGRPESICINTEGGYNCPCKEGFKEYGTKCILDKRDEMHTEAGYHDKIAAGACSGLIVCLVISFWLYWGYRKRKHMQIREAFFKQNGGLILNRLLDEREEDIESSRNARGGKKHRSIATIYTEKELSKATDNYHEGQILGRGGFGTVYKGILSNGTVVAIKKTKIVDTNQNDQFINEIAVLSQINHKNVVQLLGCCLESEVPLLVYEYITNGTLHQHLHEDRENQTASSTLSWESRLRIALEIAGALAYLHSEASIPIIHRDVKSSNVLLDDDYKAKVSDFGASRLNPTDEAQLSTVVQGTFGYLDPEYMLSNQLTDKSDVYSFGVLLVELLTGKIVFSPKRVEEERNLANYFLSSMKTNRLFVILDNNLVTYYNDQISSVHGHQQIQQTAELATKCLRMKGENRPTMKEVAMVLHGLTMITSSQPGVLDDDYMFTNTTKEERMLLSESAKLIYTDSITAVGDSSKGMLALETEGR
ncbi:hypothetical protein C5167_029098 [Papaver somniferum]|uniref:wall-associated receptor kinase 5-like n=1 Tax=Papaver somniferum TaxID=3469 RepID=UPI000E703665|nr:wall-associated receptor kinase 5-like [Papaver somniferum]RZC90032.1 hypothetical protein C5167_029098 [Papaver somniferum]